MQGGRRGTEGNHRVGIESDQLVYDYLSRVGDLAQQQQLSSGARMRLVAALRTEIDRQRGSQGTDTCGGGAAHHREARHTG